MVANGSIVGTAFSCNEPLLASERLSVLTVEALIKMASAPTTIKMTTTSINSCSLALLDLAELAALTLFTVFADLIDFFICCHIEEFVDPCQPEKTSL